MTTNYYMTFANELGIFTWRSITDDQPPSPRVPALPGAWSDTGEWIATDTSELPPTVAGYAAQAWTPEIVAAYKAANPYVPPRVETPADYVLTKRQICGALINAGQLDPDTFIKTVVGSIADTTARAHALNDWMNAASYTRDNPLFNDGDLLAAAKFTPASLDALWMAAKDLPA